MTARGWGERCRHGRGARAPCAAALSAAVLVGVALSLRGRDPVEAGLAAGASAVLVALASIDLRDGVIPNRIVYPALAAGLVASGAWPDRGLVEALAGGAWALGAALLVRVLGRGALGGGDVKMAALAGAVVGSPGVLAAGVVATLAGGAVSALLVAARRAGRGARLPYGPFLALGAIATLLR